MSLLSMRLAAVGVAVAAALLMSPSVACAVSPPDPPPSMTRTQIEDLAISQLGVWYHWGGDGTAAYDYEFDCSGYVSYCWKVGTYYGSTVRPTTHTYWYASSGSGAIICDDLPGTYSNPAVNCRLGDALVRHTCTPTCAGHIFLFKQANSDGTIDVYEARESGTQIAIYNRSVSSLVVYGYKAIRRKNVIDGPMPGSVSITYPTSGKKVLGQIDVAASASDPNGIDYALFYRSGSYLGADYTAPYSRTWETRGSVGSYTLTAKIYDELGDYTNSAGVGVTVVNNDRVYGTDRYATAVAVSKRLYPSPVARAQNVVLVRGDNWADSIAAASFARIKNAALLYVKPDELPAVTRAEIARLQPQYLYVVGGTLAISDSVAYQAQSAAGLTRYYRLAGADRFETAAKMWSYCGSYRGKVCIIAYDDLADAMSLSAAAAAQRIPVLLTRRDSLPDVTRNIVSDWGLSTSTSTDDYDVTRAYVIGGTACVDSTVYSNIASRVSTSRVYGNDRFSTAIIMAQYFGLHRSTPYLVNQDAEGHWTDAFCGGVLAGAGYDPIYLVYDASLPSCVTTEWTYNPPTKVTLLGGSAATKGYAY